MTNGTGTFSATLKSGGTFFISGTDTVTSSLTGTSNPIFTTVATDFVVTAPTTATAGVPLSFSVRAIDQFGNTAIGYTGTVHFTKSDFGSGSSVPGDYTFTTGPSGDNGIHVFGNGATFVTSGIQIVTATDTVQPGISGDTDDINVSSATATNFVIDAPQETIAGVAFDFVVTVLDQFGNTVTGYTGTVHFTSTDRGSAAQLPADYMFTTGASGDNGLHSFPNGATLVTSGMQTITATDTLTSSITGASNPIAVRAATVAQFVVSTRASATAGAAFNFTITAQDAFQNTAIGYTGTVHFTSSDAQAVLPADSSLTNGLGNFSATLKTAGSQTIAAVDAIDLSITGTSKTIAVSSGAATHFTFDAPPNRTASLKFQITVTARDASGNVDTGYTGIIHFSSSDLLATLPANYTFTSGDSGVHTFEIVLLTAGSQTLTVTDTTSASVSGTVTVMVDPALNVTGASVGQPPIVQVFNIDGSLRFRLTAFDAAFTGGVTTAVGDVNGDGIADIIAGAGPGGGPNVTAFSGFDGAQLFSFFAFDPRFIGGVSVAVGDINFDGFGDLIVGAGAGGGPNVVVVSGKDHQTLLGTWFAFNPIFIGGVSVAAGDVNGDGIAEVIVGAGPTGGPNVVVVNGASGERLASYFAYESTFAGGVSVAVGDVRGTGVAQVVTGPGKGRLVPNVLEIDALTGKVLVDFINPAGGMNGVRVGVGRASGDGRAVILTGNEFQAVSFDRAIDGLTLQMVDQFFEIASE